MSMTSFFRTEDLTVGYNGKPLIRGIDISLDKGKILTLIGANGAGKSTILKTVSRQLAPIHGNIFIGDKDLSRISGKELAQKLSVVLTERIHPEMMTCAEVTAMGRFPYTNMFGKLTAADKKIVWEALERVHAQDLSDMDFNTLSDGQKQRILLARAICQEPEVLILDEPTAYLDIRYKIELLQTLRELSRTKGTTIIMSLHEIDLAMKISDDLLCLKDNSVLACGPAERILTGKFAEELFDIRTGSYNLLFGSVELPGLKGKPRIFIIGGNGHGAQWYRLFQKKGIPFASGILFENDTDCQIAEALSEWVIKSPAFEPISEAKIEEAKEVMRMCGCVLDTGAQIGPLNSANAELIRTAEENHIPVVHDPEEFF